MTAAQLRALYEAGTPGEWEADTAEPGDCVVWGPGEKFLANVGTGKAEDGTPRVHMFDEERRARRRLAVGAVVFDADEANALLIAAMHRALPALVEVAEAAEDVEPAHPSGCECSICVAYRRVRRALAALEAV